MTAIPEPRRHGAEQRREEILDAAVRLFCEKGYEGTTIRDIAREVGITEGLIYHYFPSKAALISECWHRHSWHARALAIVQEADDRPVGEVLHHLIREHLDILYENGPAFRMHAAEMLRDGELAALSQQYNDETHDAIAAYLRRHQAAGHIRSDVDPKVVAGSILGTSVTFFIIHGRLPREEWEAVAEHMAVHFTRLLMHGLTTRQDAAD